MKVIWKIQQKLLYAEMQVLTAINEMPVEFGTVFNSI